MIKDIIRILFWTTVFFCVSVLVVSILLEVTK